MSAVKSLQPNLSEFFTECQQRVEILLRQCLDQSNADGELWRAMTYATLGGGKRIRPVLAYGAALAVGANIKAADSVACAVELIHCYSLVHDDLPAMDDDDLRRGRPSVHRAFSEATAILTGDALQSLAFEVIASNCHQGDTNNPSQRLQMIEILARASGSNGMAAGQSMDFAAVGKTLSLEQLETMHGLKTGALITASVELGALSKAEVNPQQLIALRRYAQHVGLAFQVQDDILDVTADTVTLGKPQGSDQLHDKPTYTSLLGLDGAREKASILSAQAVTDLDGFSSSADILRQLAVYIVQRTH